MMLGGLLLMALAAASPLVDADSTRRIYVSPAAVEVGEPFALVVEVAHSAARSGTELTAGELTLDDSWILLDARLEPTNLDPAAPERRVTKRIWQLASLEPGTRELAVDGLSALGADHDDAGTVTIEVAGVLGVDEDAPRPLRGFPPSFGQGADADAGWSTLQLALVAVGVLALLAGGLLTLLVVFLWKAPRTRAPREDPRARWARLFDEEAADAQRLRERHYELSRLLRDAVDEVLGCDRRGCTDDEWTAALAAEPRLDGELRDALDQVLGACARVKYAADRPSSFAVEETFTRAARVLELLEQPPAPAREAEVAS